MEYKENFFFNSNVISEDYIFYFYVLSFNAKSKEGDKKILQQDTYNIEISNFIKSRVHENYNHGSSIVDRQFLASSPFLDS